MAAPSTPLLPPGGQPILRNLSGTWIFIKERCDELEPWLESNGFSFLARKILKSAGIVTKITQSRAELSIGESSKWGSVVHQYYLDGAMHTGVDYSGRRIRTISHILRNGDIELRTYTEEGSIVIETRSLETRTVMFRRMEHWRPKTKVKPGAAVVVAPNRPDLPEHLACTCVCALYYQKVETSEEAAAGEEAERRAVDRLAKRLFGPSWASLAVPLYNTGEGEEEPAEPTAQPVVAAPLDAATESAPTDIPEEYRLTGTWTLNEARSDPLEPLLKELGVPWVARKAAANINVVITMLHTRSEVVMVDKSRMFENRTRVIPDGQPRPKTGDDGKTVTLHAWTVLDGFSPGPSAPRSGDPQATAEGTFVLCVALPGGMGRTIEFRWRDGRDMLVRTEYYNTGEERKCVITRRWEPAAPTHALAVRITPTAAPPLPARAAPPPSTASGTDAAAAGGAGAPAITPSSTPATAQSAPSSRALPPGDAVMSLIKSAAVFELDGMEHSFSGRWRMEPASYKAFSELMAGLTIPFEPSGKPPSDCSRIIHEDSGEIIIDVLVTDAVPMELSSDFDGIRLMDVFLMVSPSKLRRSTTVLSQSLSTAVVVSMYDLVMSEDERIASHYSNRNRQQRQESLKLKAQALVETVKPPPEITSSSSESLGAATKAQTAVAPYTSAERNAMLRRPVMFVSGLGVAGLIMCEWFRFDVGIALLLVSAVMLHWLCTVYAPPPP